MAEESGAQRAERQARRRARGFLRAGGLIEAQMRTAAAKRGFAQARLRALWPDIAGPEFAAICAPLNWRGRAGRRAGSSPWRSAAPMRRSCRCCCRSSASASTPRSAPAPSVASS